MLVKCGNNIQNSAGLFGLFPDKDQRYGFFGSVRKKLQLIAHLSPIQTTLLSALYEKFLRSYIIYILTVKFSSIF